MSRSPAVRARAPSDARPATLSPKAAAAVRAQIALAGGREVCFVCTVDDDGTLATARVVSRGDARSVLALPGCAQRGEMLLHNHPSGGLEPSDADLEVATRFHNDGVGFAITDNTARRVYVVVEVPRQKPEVLLEPDAIDADLGPGGPIARAHPRFEDRPGQRELARRIAGLYNHGGIGLLEAGTGVGKSLGYLLPALRWAAGNGERTVVSTATINLQEQLVGQDLPFLAGALDDQPVRFALLKGWRNYLCRLRLEQALTAQHELLEDDSGPTLTDLAAWANRTTDGSIGDLPAHPRNEVWDEVAAEPDLCTRAKCAHFDRCFLFAARRRAAQADVIVVNHHLLLADVAVRRQTQNWTESAVLPAFQRLVIDEGHHLEDAAASHLGLSVTAFAMQRLFARLDRQGGGKGLIPAMTARLMTRDDLLSAASLTLVDSRLVPSVRAARERAELLFDLLATFIEREGGGAGKPVVRLTADFATHAVWRAGLAKALDELLEETALIARALETIRERLEAVPSREEELAPLLGELRGVTRRLVASGDALRAALRPSEPDLTVRWLELRGKGGGRTDRYVAATSVPIDLAPILREDLFTRVRTTIVTSATLTADRRFAFTIARLGLTEPEVEPETAIHPSPFDFTEQALLVVPSDVPVPNVDADGHRRAVASMAHDLAEASDGGVFVLFTSHRDVREAAAALRAVGAERRWPLLVHGEDSRDVLLRRFREAGNAVLLGTASFWEGVDVPGRALRALLLAKLPFKVPTDPLTAAHCEAIDLRGGDSFRDYMLPHAALRLKQGFGRLIRATTDRGVIVIADSRLVSKRYGEDLLEGLPPARRLVEPWAGCHRAIVEFFAHGATPPAADVAETPAGSGHGRIADLDVAS